LLKITKTQKVGFLLVEVKSETDPKSHWLSHYKQLRICNLQKRDRFCINWM